METDWRTVLAERVLPELKSKLELQDYIAARIPAFDAQRHASEWGRYASRLRQQVLSEVILRGVPEAWASAARGIEWTETIGAGEGYRIRKLRYEAVPGLWIPALLYEPTQISERVPAVLNLNGHVGPLGKAVDYKQIRCINLARRGLLALNPEWLWFGELQGTRYAHNRSAYLDLVGVAGVSVFYLAMRRALDVLLQHPHVDAERVAVTGLSGGGWQTIVLSALDERVRLAVPVAGYIGLEQRTQCQGDIGDLEQNPADLVRLADYTWLTALLAPRPALLIYNQHDDCCFQAPRARQSVYEPVEPLYRALGIAERFAFHTNHDPGTHNYELDNRQQLYHFLNAHGYVAGLLHDDEIPCADEIKTAEELTVGLAPNADWRTLALQCARGGPRLRLRARSASGFATWQRRARERLAELLRYRLPELAAQQHGTSTHGELGVTRWSLATEAGLTLSALELAPTTGVPRGTLVAACDTGRVDLANVAERALGLRMRLLAVEMLFTGKACVGGALPGQFPMMLSTVGERPLGIQAGQLAAVADWAAVAFGAPVSLMGVGRQAGIASLVAVALGARATSVVVQQAPISLRLLVEREVAYDDCPTLFAFGLLHELDVRELIALALPRQITLVRPEGSPSRIRRELWPLRDASAWAGGGVTVSEEWPGPR